MGVMIVPSDVYRDIREHLRLDKKIQAIKTLRVNAKPAPGDKSIGLREAKVAVERMQHEQFDKNYPESAKSGDRIIAGPIISEIVCDFGEGPITIDVEGMQLKALVQLESLGLEACGRMLELCQVIKAFADGKRVGVIEEEE
ncbi:MAG TPA: hypothetical protein EYF95_03495 [Flavobacteriales bacterium]|nr:hypothetical protein [Flavobacteriales bacterium]